MKKLFILIVAFLFVWTASAHATGGREGASMISLDIQLKPQPDKLDIELIIKNQSDHDIELQFPTSKLYDFSIYNSDNREVYRFSKGRFFLQALQFITIKKGEEKVLKSNWDYKDNGKKLEEGSFIIKAALLPQKINGEPVMKRFFSEQEFFIPILENIKRHNEKGQLTVTGTLNMPLGDYYYTVDNGHNELIRETPLIIGKNKKEIKITINIPNLNKEPLILTIYNNHRKVVFVENLREGCFRIDSCF